MKTLIYLFIALLFASTGTFANEITIIANGDTVTVVNGDQLDLTFLPTDSLKKLGFWTNPETNVVEEKFEANGIAFYMQPGYSLKEENGNKILLGKLGDSSSASATLPGADEVKTFVSNATYEFIANGDTIKGKRGDKIDVTLMPIDTLRILAKWKNPVTGKEETKIEVGGKSFYMQPGWDLQLDTVAGTSQLTGLLGDDENAPDITEGTVPLSAKILFSLIGLCILFFGGRLLRLW